MGLIGNMIATAYSGNSAMVNYDMFVSVFGLLSLLYFLPTSFLDGYSMPMVDMALDALNVLFWFCAAVATAAYLGVHSCSNSVRNPQFYETCFETNFIRDTPAPTTSQTGPPTPQSAAAKRRPRPPSCGSAGPPSSSRSLYPSCPVAAVA